MDIKLIMKSSRSVVFEIADGGIYETLEKYKVEVNGVYVKEMGTVIGALYDLKPSTEYHICLKKEDGSIAGNISFSTDKEFVTLNVKDFGAKGDGIADDTKFIQAAILACPNESRVLIPKGTYRISNLFLKSNLRLEIAKDAKLSAITDPLEFPSLPGLIQSYDETDEYNLGTWEGNPLSMYAGILSGISVKNVLIYGEGIINGNASKENWWKNPKAIKDIFRPRLLFLTHCENIVVQGVKFCNSPSWTIHPYFSNHLSFLNLTIENPSDSPNTDGLDPESCKDVEIIGVRFSLGDDCIAVKSGKIYMGKKYKTPSERIHIYQCLMENGHGAVTVGSEMAGGVKSLIVEKCRFKATDRGLRIKTRRGRGKDAILDQIIFRNIQMDHVMTPFVVNAFYFCDPDGKAEYVQSRDIYPVDERTPCIKKLIFEDITANNCHVAAAYFDGLPEQKIEEIVMRRIHVSYAEHSRCEMPSMSLGVLPCSKKGIYAHNIKKLLLDEIQIEGQIGEAITLDNVDLLER